MARKKTSIKIEYECGWQNLYDAYLKCRKGKKQSYYAVAFETNYESGLLKLEWELQHKIYKPSRSICFVVTEPTAREIFAANFRDRVVHHLLVDFLEPVFEPKFICQSYACRKCKGIHTSINDLKKYLRQTGGKKTPYYLHLDIKSFFMSINKQILYAIINKNIKNPKVLWLSKIIIFHNPTKNFIKKGDILLWKKIPENKSLFFAPADTGLPIGNLTSQFFANIYLNELDQYIKHGLKAKYYLRYVDDFLLLNKNKKQLIIWKEKIEKFLNKRLLLQLNQKKQIINLANTGIDWLGYVVKPTNVIIRKRVVDNCKYKLKIFNQNLRPYHNSEPPKILIEQMLSVINSYYGHFKHADSFKLRRHLHNNHFKKIAEYLEPKDDSLVCFAVKTKYAAKAGQAKIKNIPLPNEHT